MNTLIISLMGLGIASAAGHDDLRRRLMETGADAHHWDETLYFLNAKGVGSGRCELGFNHQIFNQDECIFAVERLGYDVKTVTEVNAWAKVCGCSFNPTTGHVQFNKFAHPHYCYVTEENKHVGAMPRQDQNSQDDGLIAVCYQEGTVDTTPDYNVDNYYLNGEGIGSGRCEEGSDSIYHVKECEYAVESLGYEVKTMTTVNSWGAVCGCSFNAETGHVQFNEFNHPHYCYETEHNKHQGAMPAQDRNSRENRLVAVCYKKPSFEADAHPGVSRGNNYLNLAGVGSGRCERGYNDQIFNLHDCLAAAESLGYDADTIFILNSWGAVCGCSVDPERNHVQFNKFAHPQYCYETEAEKHVGSMPAQDRDSRVERLIAVCHHHGEPTGEPTSIPTATPTAGPTSTPTAIPTAGPTGTPTAIPTAGPTASGKVTLYSGDGFDGNSWEFDTLGDYAATLGDFDNDVMSSMIVEGDFKATVYVHCPKELDVTREDLRQLEEFCLTAGGAKMTLTAGRYVGADMGIPINTMSYLRVEEHFRLKITIRGDTGEEQVKFVVGSTVKTVTLTTTDQDFIFEIPESGKFSVHFLNDNGPRNAYMKIHIPTEVDYFQFANWNCGTADENPRCQMVRDGVLAWNGEYKYTVLPY